MTTKIEASSKAVDLVLDCVRVKDGLICQFKKVNEPRKKVTVCWPKNGAPGVDPPSLVQVLLCC